VVDVDVDVVPLLYLLMDIDSNLNSFLILNDGQMIEDIVDVLDVETKQNYHYHLMEMTVYYF